MFNSLMLWRADMERRGTPLHSDRHNLVLSLLDTSILLKHFTSLNNATYYSYLILF